MNKDMTRLGLFVFFDSQGIVDDYVIYLLKHLRPNFSKLVIISNGQLGEAARIRLTTYADSLFIRDNQGLDAAAYKAALVSFCGWDEVEKYDEIVEFSELKEFINAPLKSYSSGMKSRLGFAIATAVKPDVLILDEVLSVGDAAFKEKSEQRILDMMADGVTVLYVSHSTDRIRKLCNKAIILTKGQVVAKGDVNEICDMYTEMVNSK